MKLQLLSYKLAISKLSPADVIPKWATQGEFFCICKTDEELSIVCSEILVPNSVQSNKGWKGIKVVGPLDFSLTGILSQLVTCLAEEKISIFAVSTFDTDYLLIKEQNFQKAIDVLRAVGHTFIDMNPLL